jgi:hypothetical protein
MSVIPSEIHNFYETLLQQHLQALELSTSRDPDYIADLCCLVLNQLPAHYIRHTVDLCYFTSPEQRAEMESKVQDAVVKSIAWLDQKEHQRQSIDQR